MTDKHAGSLSAFLIAVPVLLLCYLGPALYISMFTGFGVWFGWLGLVVLAVATLVVAMFAAVWFMRGG